MTVFGRERKFQVLHFVKRLVHQRDAEHQRAEAYREVVARLAQERDAAAVAAVLVELHAHGTSYERAYDILEEAKNMLLSREWVEQHGGHWD